MPETSAADRRSPARRDRRRHSRNGRRDGDPRVNWRRVAWLFAAYAVYISLRALPRAVGRRLKRRETPAA